MDGEGKKNSQPFGTFADDGERLLFDFFGFVVVVVVFSSFWWKNHDFCTHFYFVAYTCNDINIFHRQTSFAFLAQVIECESGFGFRNMRRALYLLVFFIFFFLTISLRV